MFLLTLLTQNEYTIGCHMMMKVSPRRRFEPRSLSDFGLPRFHHHMATFKRNISSLGYQSRFFYYSLLSASTGSLRDALFAGMSPAMNESATLIKMRISPAIHGKLATSGTSKSA